MFGEGDRGNVAKLIAALDRGRFLWPGSGKNQKSLIYNDDAAWACLRALEPLGTGIDIFNVSAPAVTMREIVTAICQALGCRVPRLSVPRPLLYAASTISDLLGDPRGLREQLRKFIRDDVYSGSKFEAAYDFRPAVPLSEGIQREVMFLRSQSPPDCSRPQAAR
jgi:nucleoside-diphosphate-sugar epimerase